MKNNPSLICINISIVYHDRKCVEIKNSVKIDIFLLIIFRIIIRFQFKKYKKILFILWSPLFLNFQVSFRNQLLSIR